MPSASPFPRAHDTANERFKRGFNAWFWIGLTLATGVHAGVFMLSPTFELHAMGPGDEPIAVMGAPEIDIPPPPEDIAPPVAPVPVEGLEAEEPAFPLTTLERNPARFLPSPSAAGDGDPTIPFTPMTLRPELRNAGEVARALARLYPPALRDAGIGGTTLVWFHIDVNGRVVETRLRESSGYEAFDRAALEVAGRMRFSPAYNRDQRVPVWVSIPVTFEVRD